MQFRSQGATLRGDGAHTSARAFPVASMLSSASGDSMQSFVSWFASAALYGWNSRSCERMVGTAEPSLDEPLSIEPLARTR